LRYYLVEPSAPPDDRRKLPVLVCLAGADGDFRGTALRFARSRDRAGLPVVLVVPCTFSSSNALWGAARRRYAELYGEGLVRSVGGAGPIPDVRSRLAWDEEGLLAALADLRRRLPLEERVYVTGFSAGGILAWWLALRHPGLLAGVVPVCANHAFWAVGPQDASRGNGETPAFRVRILSGERDPLRRSRIGLPMPPVGLSLILGVVAAAGFGALVWRHPRRGRNLAAAGLGAALLVGALVAGRLSGNDAQCAIAVELLEGLGHEVEWQHQPGMGHEPAPDLVLATIAAWRRK
jgi:poly(3-hydroxybutyrate) depolymerase